MSSQYIIFGVVAMFLITLMLVLSTKAAVKWFGYEFFKITHWIIAVLYIGACWGHWDRLWCWMVPSLALIGIDQMLRVMRICYIHMGGKTGKLGFRAAQAEIKVLGQDDDLVVRLDFEYEHREAWKAGQHFHLCFPSLSIWQSHPFTASSSPDSSKTTQHHTYILRVRSGQTAELATLESTSIPIILTGPYGNGHPKYETPNVLTIAGGTGVTFTLPIALEALNQPIIPQAVVDFVWIIRRSEDLLWLATELGQLKAMLKNAPSLRIKIFITRESQSNAPVKESKRDKDVSEASSGSSQERREDELLEINSPRFSIEFLGDHHPSVAEVVDDFMERSANKSGSVEIVGSGPEELGSDLRSAVANINGSEAIEFYWDSRE
jgi:NAD(P)H-flavin reductase